MEPTPNEFPCCSGDWEIVVARGVLSKVKVCPSASLADNRGGDQEVEGGGVGDVGEDIGGLEMRLGVVIVVSGMELGAETSEARGDT